MDVVVVESPTKAKTINKYLGGDYTVLSSFGHVRDLPEKDGSVIPEDDFNILYDVMPTKKKQVSDIAKAVKGADRLYLATDPDREGEAISWHLLAALNDAKAIKNTDVKRIVFNEVTKRAVLDAIANPRELDQNLIDAYQARRALDYLVGFTLSPILWRKLSGSRSAGRVQSVSLRLICDRETEIEAFRSQEYWSVEAKMATHGGDPFDARLVRLGGKRLDKFGLTSEEDAKAAVEKIRAAALTVSSVEKKQVSRNPSPPFSTSTLQQEAARKLGFSAKQTMQMAQRLFEGIDLGGETTGLITYMRTDSVQISNDALAQCRSVIGSRFGQNYVPEKPRMFKTKTKNAQEAHEAVRPTDLMRAPEKIAGYLDKSQLALYRLIWQRTLASQMAAAKLDRVTAEIDAADQSVGLRATGSVVAFDGFLKLYQEGRDDSAEEIEGGLLPKMAMGETSTVRDIKPSQHFTEPPPRYTEASLVRKMEELGIGRPSTYASIISVLQDRNYVRLESKRFIPEDRGRIVSAFLSNFFDRYVQADFTAQLEEKLDGVASGERFYKDVLREFWNPFSEETDKVREIRVSEVIDRLDEHLSDHLFPANDNGHDARICGTCGTGRLGLRIGKFGAFIGCSNYPECRFTQPLTKANRGEGDEEAKDRELGTDPATGLPVWLKVGRFGPYVERMEEEKPKRSSLPPSMTPSTLSLEDAIGLLALPREIDMHPETGDPVLAGINRYGPFVQHQRTYVRLGADEDVLTIGMNRAMSLLAEAANKKGGRRGAEPLRTVGEHPDDGEAIQLFDGRYGPYVKHGKINASLPKGADPQELTLEEAVRLIAERAAKVGSKPKKAAASKTKAKTTAKKPAAKKAPAKKPAAKKATTARKPRKTAAKAATDKDAADTNDGKSDAANSA